MQKPIIMINHISVRLNIPGVKNIDIRINREGDYEIKVRVQRKDVSVINAVSRPRNPMDMIEKYI